MAALWPLSRIPQIDPSGNPYSGAQAFFYNPGTTTPQTTYADGGLSTPNAHNGAGAVVADASGRFPAVFFNTTPGQYHVRVTDADGIVLFDDDYVDVYQSATYVPPSAGSTDPTLLASTGDIKARHATGSLSGWVRANGKTIGSATSGGTERANADCSALFQHLWTQDSTLTVSGGRGATAAGDWAANKTIALPDWRGRVPAGLEDMGNSAAALLSGNTVDNGETTTTLGATLGVGTHTLTTPQIPSHTHTGTTSTNGAHTHQYAIGSLDADGGIAADGTNQDHSVSTTSNGDHNHTFTSDATGGGGAHPNVQPTVLVTWLIKL